MQGFAPTVFPAEGERSHLSASSSQSLQLLLVSIRELSHFGRVGREPTRAPTNFYPVNGELTKSLPVSWRVAVEAQPRLQVNEASRGAGQTSVACVLLIVGAPAWPRKGLIRVPIAECAWNCAPVCSNRSDVPRVVVNGVHYQVVRSIFGAVQVGATHLVPPALWRRHIPTGAAARRWKHGLLRVHGTYL